MAEEVTDAAVDDGLLLTEIGARDSQVTAFLEKKDRVQALLVALQNPPINTKSESVKGANLSVIEKVLSAFQDSDITAAVQQMDMDTCDVMMKYLYKSMEHSTSYSTVLKMHAQLTEKAGLGSIVRVLTDRKTV